MNRQDRQSFLFTTAGNYDYFCRDYTDDSQWWKCQYGYGDCCHAECKPVPITRQPVINEKPIIPVKRYNPLVKQVKPVSNRVDVTDNYLRG